MAGIYSAVKTKILFSNSGTILVMFTTPHLDFCVAHFIPFVTLKDDYPHGVYPCEKDMTLETDVESLTRIQRAPSGPGEHMMCGLRVHTYMYHFGKCKTIAKKENERKTVVQWIRLLHDNQFMKRSSLVIGLTSICSTGFSCFLRSLRSRIARLSLSSLMVVMTTLLGWMPMGVVEPFDLSRCTRSTWITHFLRYTCVTLPSRPLYFPRTIRTSSSLRTGSERVYILIEDSAGIGRLDYMLNVRCAWHGAPWREQRT